MVTVIRELIGVQDCNFAFAYMHPFYRVGYHRRNMLVPIPEFKDLSEYNKELLLNAIRI